MSKSTPWKLNEKKGVRTSKLHFHRFARFLRFLRDADIEVKFTKKDNDRIIYAGDGRDEHASILDLVIDVLEVHPDIAEDYFSKRLGIDDTHSANKDKVVGDGLIIEGIHPYFKSDGPVDQEISRFSKYYYFYRPEVEEIPDLYFWWQVFKEDFKWFEKSSTRYVDDYIKGGYNMSNEFLTPPQWVFGDKIQELKRFSKSNLQQESKEYKKLRKFLKIYLATYKKLNREKESNEIAVGLNSLYKIYHRKKALDSLQEKEKNIRSFINSTEQKFHTQKVRYRYEVLWFIKREQIPIESLSSDLIVLYYLAMAEYIGAQEMIERTVMDLLSELRFVIYGMDNEVAPSFQKDSLTLKDLSKILSDYRFENLSEAFELTNRNILSTRILKVPEKHADPARYSSEDIRRYLRQSFGKWFYSKIATDIGFADTELAIQEI